MQSDTGVLDRIRAAERSVYEFVPGRDAYAKLLLRTLLWFSLLTLGYHLLTSF